MPAVDIDLVDIEHASNLAEDRGASSFDTIRAEDSVDVIRVN